MRESPAHDDDDERMAELQARINLTTAMLAHTEANLARQLIEVRKRDAEIERLSASKVRRLIAHGRSLVAWMTGPFRASQ